MDGFQADEPTQLSPERYASLFGQIAGHAWSEFDESEWDLWQRSSFQDGAGGVEVAWLGDRIALRDGKCRSGPSFEVEREAWIAFIKGVRDGGLNM
jgi:hypothetical protein